MCLWNEGNFALATVQMSSWTCPPPPQQSSLEPFGYFEQFRRQTRDERRGEIPSERNHLWRFSWLILPNQALRSQTQIIENDTLAHLTTNKRSVPSDITADVWVFCFVTMCLVLWGPFFSFLVFSRRSRGPFLNCWLWSVNSLCCWALVS